ncbi:MAG: Rid family detoxifying hydrolase [Gammaproteobacteria bacterium]|nr:Rid family detoxifying hydrolase [Gammaproteobacteria bacterium]NNF65942.1 RidA family protein [Gammaproteobacteria bacterium]
MPRKAIQTDAAPKAIGTYSQAAQHGGTVYLSGQIPLIPDSGELVTGDIVAQIRQVFKNLSAVADAAGGSLADVVKLNVYLIDLDNFPVVSDVMPEFLSEPYPARAVVGVSALPKGANVEIDAVIELT